jgi:hypothetical protein
MFYINVKKNLGPMKKKFMEAVKYNIPRSYFPLIDVRHITTRFGRSSYP